MSNNPRHLHYYAAIPVSMPECPIASFVLSTDVLFTSCTIHERRSFSMQRKPVIMPCVHNHMKKVSSVNTSRTG